MGVREGAGAQDLLGDRGPFGENTHLLKEPSNGQGLASPFTMTEANELKRDQGQLRALPTSVQRSGKTLLPNPFGWPLIALVFISREKERFGYETVNRGGGGDEGGCRD